MQKPLFFLLSVGVVLVALVLVLDREGHAPLRATRTPTAAHTEASSTATGAAAEREAGEPLGRTVAMARIHGRVLDPRDGSPVPGCDLYRREGGLGFHLGTTDAAGSFALEPSDAGPFVLELRTPPQWDAVVAELILDEAQREGERAVLLHALRAAASPVFAVVSCEGVPQAGLGLSIRDGHAMEEVRTDAEGRFTTALDFRHGEIRIRSSELKWARVREPRFTHPRRVDAERPLAVEVELGPLFRLDVTWPEEAPRLRLVASLRTTKVPRFAVSGWRQSILVAVPPGNPVSVRFPVRSRAEETLRLELRDESGAWVGRTTVASTGSTDPERVALVRAASLSGVVLGPGQEPLEAIGVFLAQEIPGSAPEEGAPVDRVDHDLASDVVYSDAEGRWSLPSVLPGRYVVIAVGKGKVDTSPSVLPIDLAAGAHRRLELHFDPSRRPVFGSLSGRLVAPGAPIPGKVSVSLERVLENRDDPLETWQAREHERHRIDLRLERDGAAWAADFVFDDVRAGTYSLSAHAGWFEVQPGASRVVVPSGGHALTVRNDVSVKTLVVRVTDLDTGAPLSRPEVLIGQRSFGGKDGEVVARDVPDALTELLAVRARGYRSREIPPSDLRLEEGQLFLDAKLERDGD